MYIEKKFRVCTRRLQGFTNKDFKRAFSVLKKKEMRKRSMQAAYLCDVIEIKGNGGLVNECNNGLC
jgi:hypothetical protein